MKINKISLIIILVAAIFAMSAYVIFRSYLFNPADSYSNNVAKPKIYSESEKDAIIDSLGQNRTIDNQEAQEILKGLEGNSSYSHDERMRILNQL